VGFLLVDVPEVGIEIGHGGLPIVVQGHDILMIELTCESDKVGQVEKGRT
jgi:hypothetical protein